MTWSENLRRPLYYYEQWKYKNLALLVASLALLYYLADHRVVQGLIAVLGEFGYPSAVIAGMFFVSTFTVAPAMLVLYRLAEVLDPYLLAVFAGAGAVLGDYLIFRFVRDGVMEELKPLFQKLEAGEVGKILHTPYFFWLAPVVGAILIASPLPDEVGISILGISRIKPWQFIILSFALNAVGIFLVIMAARYVP